MVTASSEPLDAYDLPPTQALALEVLAARYRLGEPGWSFSVRHRQALKALEARGLIGWKPGIDQGTCMAWLTDAGREAVLSDEYKAARAELDDLHWLLAACPEVILGRHRNPASPLRQFWLNVRHPDGGKTALFQGDTAAAALAGAREWSEREGITP